MDNLQSLMSVQSVSYDTGRMQLYIQNSLKLQGLSYEKDSYGNMYVTKGDADLYPTMVCHIDTVHEINNNMEVHISGDNMFAIDNLTMERLGIGGDDKVGIWITLQALENHKNFKAVFFLDEEMGCVGSSKADFSFFDDSTIVLQCDRKGNTDFVNNISGTEMFGKELSKVLKPILKDYKYKEAPGGMTDVMEIASNTDVCCANMSCGYYDPHTDNEYISINDVYETLEMCMDIFEATLHKRFTITRIKHNYANYYDGYYDSWYDKQDPIVSKDNTICPNCNLDQLYFDEWDNVNYCLECEYEQKLAE
jgi:tripeptide aminopeptidase